MPKILVVDDQRNMRTTLSMMLRGAGYDVDEAGDGDEAQQSVLDETYDLVLTDLKMGGKDGMDVLRFSKERSPLTEVIVMTAYGTIESAVEAMRIGAYDYIQKPFTEEELLVKVQRAAEKRQLAGEMSVMAAEFRERYKFDNIIGRSAAVRDVLGRIVRIAPTDTTVLITGESGTGKELVARAIHANSNRADKPFVSVNCAAISETLLESELFGYERGAFTGAQARRKGMFELADGGTLFLDEIGDMSLNAQAKVLRALQSGEITRVGSEKSIAVDVRVVAATNKDLEKAITDGEFREDLFFRLNVVPLRSPGLRERRDDIPALAAAFLRDFCAENGLKDKPIGPEVLERLQQKAWPGNVRELRNVVERMAILSGDVIEVEYLPADGKLARAAARESGEATPDPIHDEDGRRLTLREYRDRAERRYLVSTLEECEWNVSKAASMLGVERTNLHKKMRSLGVQRDEP